jgi:hypothetical protein
MRVKQMRTGGNMTSAAVLAGLALVGLFPEHARATPYKDAVLLHGPVATSKISGYPGTAVRLEVDDEQAIYAISSQERRDNPCALIKGTESINDPAEDTGDLKNLCGATPTSRAMRAEYRDDMYFGRRVFVTGIRVCTNNRETRVKGFQLRGKEIDEDGRVAELVYLEHGPTRLVSGEWDLSQRDEHVNDSKSPADYRNNCREWHAWAECPHPNQVATGLISHFEAGTPPRSLTGVALQCQYVSQSYVGAVRK